MATTLDRDDIITGLRELIAELRAEGEVAGIRLVGGAALSLRYFDRGTTQDLDSLHYVGGDTPRETVVHAPVGQIPLHQLVPRLLMLAGHVPHAWRGLGCPDHSLNRAAAGSSAKHSEA